MPVSPFPNFNLWSCQLWEKWEENERKAYTYAAEANRLDDTDHVVQMILSRILLYRRRFDQAEAHTEKSLALNANDADCLIQLAFNKTYLGKAAEGERLFLKAMRLNPFRDTWYYPYGALTFRRYDDFIEMASKASLTDVWVDLPALLAIACHHAGQARKAAEYIEIFIANFSKKITAGQPVRSEEIIDWMKLANPFKYEEDTQFLLSGLMAAGLRGYDVKKQPAGDKAPPSGYKQERPNTFVKKERLWHMCFDDRSVQIPEVKGFIDIARLLAVPDKEIHCSELMGTLDSLSEPEPMLDEKGPARL
jgi:tetratricopeptide (TPR) repeat protein